MNWLEFWEWWQKIRSIRGGASPGDRESFRRLVLTEEDGEKVKTALAQAVQLREKTTLSIPEFLQLVLSDTTPVSVGVQKTEILTTPLVSDPHPEIGEAFDRVWKIWPVNLEHRESEERARSMFREAVAKLGLEVVERVCKNYSRFFDDGEAGAFPYHLGNFLSRSEVLEEWLERDKNRASDLFEEVFVRCWEAWPRMVGAQRTNRQRIQVRMLFRRMVPDHPLDLLDALLVCRAIRDYHESHLEFLSIGNSDMDSAAVMEEWGRKVPRMYTFFNERFDEDDHTLTPAWRQLHRLSDPDPDFGYHYEGAFGVQLRDLVAPLQAWEMENDMDTPRHWRNRHPGPDVVMPGDFYASLYTCRDSHAPSDRLVWRTTRKWVGHMAFLRTGISDSPDCHRNLSWVDPNGRTVDEVAEDLTKQQLALALTRR